MSKKRARGNDIVMHEKLYHISNFLRDAKKLDEEIWDIDTKLGAMNVFSRLSSDTVDKFNINHKQEKIIQKIEKALAKSEYQIDKKSQKGFNFFKKAHRLSEKSGMVIWGSLSNKDKEPYITLAAVPDNKHMLSLYDTGFLDFH